MTRYVKSILLILFFSFSAVAHPIVQTNETYQGKTINAVDEAGLKQGPWIFFGKDKKLPGYKDDQKVEEGEYVDGRKNGVWITYFPNQKVKSEITYASNRPSGPYKVYYENGQLQEQGNWKSNRNVGVFKRFYENGEPQQEFNFSERGKREGKQKYFHENGQLMIEGDWTGGKESGELKEYYANGELRSVKYFNDGSIDATKTKKFEPKQEIVEKPAPKADPAPNTTASVKKTVVVDKKANKPNIGYFDGNGTHTLYNRNRQITQKGLFKNGKLMDGKWYRYNKDGILTNIEIYKNGVYVGEGVIDKDKK